MAFLDFETSALAIVADLVDPTNPDHSFNTVCPNCQHETLTDVVPTISTKSNLIAPFSLSEITLAKATHFYPSPSMHKYISMTMKKDKGALISEIMHKVKLQ